MRDIEDCDVFGGCDVLSEISFGGSKSEWRTLTGGREITIERGDMTVFSPHVSFLDIKEL